MFATHSHPIPRPIFQPIPLGIEDLGSACGGQAVQAVQGGVSALPPGTGQPTTEADLQALLLQLWQGRGALVHSGGDGMDITRMQELMAQRNAAFDMLQNMLNKTATSIDRIAGSMQ